MIRVAVADRESLTAHGLAGLINAERDMRVTRICCNSAAVRSALKSGEADVLVLDPSGLSSLGFRFIRQVRMAAQNLGIVVVTSRENERHLLEAVRAGARAYIGKSASKADLMRAIRAVAQGAGLLSAEATGDVLNAFARQSQEETGLSPRQRQLLSGIVRAKTNRDIADELHLSEKTVKNYMRGLFSVLGVRDRTEAAVHALKMDLVTEDEWETQDADPAVGQARASA